MKIVPSGNNVLIKVIQHENGNHIRENVVYLIHSAKLVYCTAQDFPNWVEYSSLENFLNDNGYREINKTSPDERYFRKEQNIENLSCSKNQVTEIQTPYDEGMSDIEVFLDGVKALSTEFTITERTGEKINIKWLKGFSNKQLTVVYWALVEWLE